MSKTPEHPKRDAKHIANGAVQIDLNHMESTDLEDTSHLPGIIALLGDLKPGAIITEEGLANLFQRHTASVKRAVQRGELPPPCRLFGGNAWTVGVLLRHIEARLEDAAKDAETLERKIAHLSP